jgi:hypothetical protein
MWRVYFRKFVTHESTRTLIRHFKFIPNSQAYKTAHDSTHVEKIKLIALVIIFVIYLVNRNINFIPVYHHCYNRKSIGLVGHQSIELALNYNVL